MWLLELKQREEVMKNFEIGDNSFEYFEMDKCRGYYTLLIVQFLLNI